MTGTCRLCGGRRTITMNLVPQLDMSAVAPQDDEDVTLDFPTERKEYACPECTPTVRESDLSVLEVEGKVSLDTLQYAKDVEGVKMHIRVNLAKVAADKLVRSECFKFTEGGIDDWERTQSFKGQVLVGKIGSLDNILEQVKQERQSAITDVLETILAESNRIWQKSDGPGIAYKWLQSDIRNVLDNIRRGRYD